MRPFSRHRHGVRLRLTADEVEMLRVVPQLLGTVGAMPDDPAAERLSLDVYPHDPQAAEEYRRLMATEVEAGRNADRSAFAVSLEAAAEGPVVLSADEAEAWLMVLGEARLALAARLGIEEEGWGEDPNALNDPSMALLHYLSWLQGALTDVLLEAG